jgi:hypothetical protein
MRQRSGGCPRPMPPLLTGRTANQSGKHGPVRSGQARSADLAAQHGDLVAKHHQLGNRRRFAAGYPRKPAELTNGSQVQQPLYTSATLGGPVLPIAWRWFGSRRSPWRNQACWPSARSCGSGCSTSRDRGMSRREGRDVHPWPGRPDPPVARLRSSPHPTSRRTTPRRCRWIARGHRRWDGTTGPVRW